MRSSFSSWQSVQKESGDRNQESGRKKWNPNPISMPAEGVRNQETGIRKKEAEPQPHLNACGRREEKNRRGAETRIISGPLLPDS